MKILFSPVSINDPYFPSADPEDLKEGPLLRLCRQEQPECVYLDLYGEALAQEQDSRSCRTALEQLGFVTNIRAVIRQNVNDDTTAEEFQDDFRGVLKDLRADYPDAELIVNVFSATEPMQEAFTALAAEAESASADAEPEIPAVEAEDAAIADDADDADIAEDPAPDEAETEDEMPVSDEDFTADDLAAETDAPAELPAADAAETPDAETAAPEAAEPAADTAEPETAPEETADPVYEEQCRLLCKLIDAYEYRAAQLVCMNMEKQPPAMFSALLDAAVVRSSGKWAQAQKQFCDLGQSTLTAGIVPAAEYFMRQNILAEKDECTAFFRGMPAILTEVFLAAIRTQFHTDLTQYMIYASRKWDENKLVIAQMTGKFSETFKYHTKPKPMKVGGFVTAAHLSNFMENASDSKKHGQMILDTLKLRQATEDKVRNVTTYSLSTSRGEDLRRFNLTAPDELMLQLRDYIRNYTDIALTDEVLQSYQKMNALLKSSLNEEA